MEQRSWNTDLILKRQSSARPNLDIKDAGANLSTDLDLDPDTVVTGIHEFPRKGK